MHTIFNYIPNYITLQAIYICIHIRPILAREEFVKYTSTNITQKLFFSRLHSQAAKLKFSTHSNEIFVNCYILLTTRCSPNSKDLLTN